MQARGEYQRVAAVAVGFRKCAAMRHRSARCVQGLFTLFDFEGHVAIDDQASVFDPNSRGDAAAELPIVEQREVGILCSLRASASST